MNNTLKLRKCAYIFDPYKMNYYFSHDTFEKHCKIENELMKVYKKEHDGIYEWFKDENNRLYIIVAGFKDYITPLQIEYINGVESVINDVTEIKQPLTNKYFMYYDWDKEKNHLYSLKYKSLNCENFTGINDLGYYRINFNGYSTNIMFLKDGTIVTPTNHSLNNITVNEICDNLNISKSSNARKEIKSLINDILSRNNLS